MSTPERITPDRVPFAATLSRVAGTRSLTPEQAARVREALREYVAKLGVGGQTRAGEALGIKQQHVSRVIRTDAPEAPGYTLAIRLAPLVGLSVEALLSGETSSAPDRYPARVKAIARAKEDGRSDRAIQAVATFQGHDADALTVEAWSNLIMNFEAAFAAGKLGAKKTK